MKKCKKLKVLVGLFTMFSLFSLTNVSAMEERVTNSVEEIKEENIKEETKEEIKKQGNEKTNMRELVNFNEKNEKESSNKETLNKNFENGKKLDLRKQDKKKYYDETEEKIVEEEKVITKDEITKDEITKEEINKLEKIFLEKNSKYDEIFKNIFSCLGHMPKNKNSNESLNVIGEIEPPYMQKFFHHIKKHAKTLNGKRVSFKEKKELLFDKVQYRSELIDFDNKNFIGKFKFYDPESSIFSNFENKHINVNKYFGADWFKILSEYYIDCFKENYEDLIFFDDDYEKNGVFKYDLKPYLKFAIRKNEDFTKACEELIKLVLTELYLKSFFVSCFAPKYLYENEEVVKCILKFSDIINRALSLEFDEDGLSGFNLDFERVINNYEDREFLKCFIEVVDKQQKDCLMYDLYIATCSFLHNKNFWNNMLGILVYKNCQEVKSGNYEGFENIISNEYFNLYNGIYENMKNNDIYVKKEKKINRNIDFNNKNFKDFDFGTLNARFKKMFCNLPVDETGKSRRGVFTNDEKNIKPFSINDALIVSYLKQYFKNRFSKSFNKHVNGEKTSEIWLDFLNFKPNLKFKIYEDKNPLSRNLENDYFTFEISEAAALECLNYAAQNEKIRKECIDLIKFLFIFTLTESFIRTHSDDSDLSDVLLLRFVEYFESILDFRFEKNEDGKLIFKLGFKNADGLNYCAKVINYVVENINNKIKDEKEWEKVNRQEKMIYRLYLTARAFVSEEKFWNRYLAFFVCNMQYGVARNISTYGGEFYDEYKKVNEKIGQDKVFLNANDKKFIDFISGKKYKNFKDSLISSNKNSNYEDFSKYFEYYEDSRGEDEKEKLVKIFENNIKVFSDYFDYLFKYDRKEFERILSKIMGKEKHDEVFALKSGSESCIVNSLLKFSDKYFKYGYVSRLAEDYLKYFATSKKLINEAISFIKDFFAFYEEKIILLNYNKVLKELEKSYNNEDSTLKDFLGKVELQDFIRVIVQWYVKSFDVEFKDGRFIFNFNFKYFEDFEKYVKKAIEIFINFKNKDKDIIKNIFPINNKKNYINLEKETYKEKLENIIYNLHLGAFAFLNSEDFWNEFISLRYVENLKGILKEDKDKIAKEQIQKKLTSIHHAYVNNESTASILAKEEFRRILESEELKQKILKNIAKDIELKKQTKK